MDSISSEKLGWWSLVNLSIRYIGTFFSKGNFTLLQRQTLIDTLPIRHTGTEPFQAPVLLQCRAYCPTNEHPSSQVKWCLEPSTEPVSFPFPFCMDDGRLGQSVTIEETIIELNLQQHLTLLDKFREESPCDSPIPANSITKPKPSSIHK